LSAQPSLVRIVVAAMAVQLFVVFATLAPSVLGPKATESLGVEPATLGIFFALQNLGAMLGCLLLTGVVHRFGAIRASQLGALGVGLGTMLCATGLPLVIVPATFAIGLTAALITPSSTVLLARATPPQHLNLVFSVKQSVVPLAAALAGLIVPWLLGLTDWRGTMLLIGAISIVFVAAIQPLRSAADSGRDRNAPYLQLNLMDPLKLTFRFRALRYIALGGFVFNGAQQLLWIYFVTYLHLELGYSLASAGGIFAVSQVTATLGRIGWGWLADRLRDPFLVLVGLAAGASLFFVAFALLDTAWPFWLMLLTVMALSGTVASWNGVHLAAIARFAPRERLHVTTGAVQLFSFLGGVLAPALFASVVWLTGRYSTAYLASCLLPLVFFIALASPRRRRMLSGAAA
jgi:MFS family permease